MSSLQRAHYSQNKPMDSDGSKCIERESLGKFNQSYVYVYEINTKLYLTLHMRILIDGRAHYQQTSNTLTKFSKVAECMHAAHHIALSILDIP